jgi:hypothetical protein
VNALSVIGQLQPFASTELPALQESATQTNAMAFVAGIRDEFPDLVSYDGVKAVVCASSHANVSCKTVPIKD